MTTFAALRQGYVLFYVNGRYYFRYGRARRRKDLLVILNEDIVFEGFHLGRWRWEGFYFSLAAVANAFDQSGATL
jgi:hypothetical protein